MSKPGRGKWLKMVENRRIPPVGKSAALLPNAGEQNILEGSSPSSLSAPATVPRSSGRFPQGGGGP